MNSNELLKKIDSVIAEYKSSRKKLDISTLSALVLKMEGYRVDLMSQKGNVEEQFDKYFVELSAWISRAKQDINNRTITNGNNYALKKSKSIGYKAGFGAIWFFGAATGVALFGLIILGALYL